MKNAFEIDDGALPAVDAEKKDAIRRDAIRGSLLGGAIGDALGFPVEFKGEDDIVRWYGDGGIQALKINADTGTAIISDDTQMSLFTANGILYGITYCKTHGVRKPLELYVAMAYQDWLCTQTMRFSEWQSQRNNGMNCVSWVADLPELYHKRGPGYTCISALRQAKGKKATEAHNDSKGCGGVMRVAPMGLVNMEDLDIETADRYGAMFAAITHGHSLGFLPAAALVHVLRRIVYSRNDQTLRQIVLDARDTVARLYARNDYICELTQIIDLAIELSENGERDIDNIHRLGKGGVAEETLAIAVYCALRHQDDFSAAIIAAVNHRGDSDSTGAVTGNILGAWLGYDAIDDKWKRDLELRDVLLEMADDLYTGCPIDRNAPGQDSDWTRKYVDIRWAE